MKREEKKGKGEVKGIPQEHWEIRSGLTKGNNKNPYEVYFAKRATEWPQPHKKTNCCDY